MAHGPSLPTAKQHAGREPIDVIAGPFQRFAQLESSGGILLLLATAVALVWANSGAADAYFTFFNDTRLSVGFGERDAIFTNTLKHWIDDALMGFFFLLVGLEIKREILVGELSSPRRAALPIAAAFGGMIVPAVIYAAVNLGRPSIHGWGVPMATDIAFAIGVLALLGSRIPVSLRVFLVSLAIVDDLGALAIIAIFYTDDLNLHALSLAGGVTGILIAINLLRVRWPVPYLFLSIPLWYFVYKSGVHATVSGVVLAATIPATGRVDSRRFLDSSRHAMHVFQNAGEPGSNVRSNPVQRAAVLTLMANCRQVLPPLNRIEHVLVPWVAFFVVPVFALANAGVTLGEGTGELVTGPISIGIALGLIVGKPVGVVLFSWLAVRLGIGSLPTNVTWRHIIGAGFLAGIGFTMALFIAGLAFTEQADLDASKIAVLGASAIAGVTGFLILLGTPKVAPDAKHEVH